MRWIGVYAGVVVLGGLGTLFYFLSGPEGRTLLGGRHGTPPPQRLPDQPLTLGTVGEVSLPVLADGYGYHVRFGLELPETGAYSVAFGEDSYSSCELRAADGEGAELPRPVPAGTEQFVGEFPAGRVLLAFACPPPAGGSRLRIAASAVPTIVPGVPAEVTLAGGARRAAARLEVAETGQYSVAVRSPSWIEFRLDPDRLGSTWGQADAENPALTDPPLALEAGRHLFVFLVHDPQGPVGIDVRVTRVE
jgi:hypothetical protein